MEVGTAFVSSASSLRQLVPRAKMNSARAPWPIGCARPLWARLVLGLRRAGVTCFVVCLAMQSVGRIATARFVSDDLRGDRPRFEIAVVLPHRPGDACDLVGEGDRRLV